MPLVTFFVQVYNTSHYVGECIQAILSQEGGYDFEVLIIDDASTDGSRDAIAKFEDPRITVVCHTRNQGAAATLNEGIRLAKGEFIARIDSDDRHRPGFLRETLPVFDLHPEAGAVYGRIAMIDAEGRPAGAGQHPFLPGADHVGDRFMDLLEEHFVSAPTLIARREVWALATPVPEDMHFCDWYVALRMAERWPLAFRSAILADYRVHPENAHHKMILDRSGEATYRRVMQILLDAPGREGEKAKAKSRILARRAAKLGDEYFGAAMMQDARRCYWEALRRAPAAVLSFGILRRLAGAWLGRARYERWKRAVLHLLGRSGPADRRT